MNAPMICMHAAAVKIVVARVLVALAADADIKGAARVSVRTAIDGQEQTAIAIGGELGSAADFDNRGACIVADGANQFTFGGAG